MDILAAIEYKKGHYSITALKFDKVVWAGVTLLDWDLAEYSDLFYLWNRDDLSDFTDFKLDLLSFKFPDWNPCCRRYGWAAKQEVTLWASASRIWFYTGHYDFSTIDDWKEANK